jgi:hypothetical protein
MLESAVCSLREWVYSHTSVVSAISRNCIVCVTKR